MRAGVSTITPELRLKSDADNKLDAIPCLHTFDVAGDLAHRAERVLDDVGAGERAPEFVRQAEADDGEDLLQPLQDAARDARFLMLQTACSN